MKKREWIAYVMIWSAMVGVTAWGIYSVGFQRLIFTKAEEREANIEDRFLYEQLLLENEQQVQTEQRKEMEEEQSETAAVISEAATGLLERGTFLSECFIVDPNTTLTLEEAPPKQLLEQDMSMKAGVSEPQILIYHTHATEGYVDSVDGDDTTTVVGVGDYLMELLTVRYGYHVLHIEEKYDLAEGVLDRSGAYNHAREGIAEVLEAYPNIQVVIDLHRDGVDESRHLVTEINGKPTAQIMFFNGLSKTNEKGILTSLPNDYIQENLAFSLQMELLCDHYYPDFVRGVYVKGYRYNLHVRPQAMLLEVGAQTNTLEEAKNAMEPFAEILDKLLKGT